jgi:glycogen operon protein
LRPANFYTAAQLQWFTPAGVAPDSAYWTNASNHALAWRLDGAAFGDPAAAVYVAYNGWSGDVTFTLPAPPASRQWFRVTDTSTWAEGPDQVRPPGAEDPLGGTPYLLHGRALLLLVAR